MRQHCSHLEIFAQRSFNYLVNNYDPAVGTPYFWTFLRRTPPEFRHDAWDVGDGMGRRLDALVTCRIMTGSSDGAAREAQFRKTLYGCFHAPHGLLWRPEAPWCQPVAEMMDQASSIFGVVSDYLETGSSQAEAIIERLARGLTEIAVRDGKGLRFPGSTYFPAGWTSAGPQAAGPHDHRQDATWLEGDPAYYGRLLIPFTRYAQASGSKAAMELCQGLAHDIVHQSNRFGPNGEFSRAMHGEKSVWTNGHFHSRYATAAGLARLALLTGDARYADFARKVFDWGLEQGTLLGWFPEFAGRRCVEEGCETCTITDAIDLAIQLAKLGDKRGYELAERFATNHLVESQVWDIGFCDQVAQKPDTQMSSFDRVAGRSVGGFVGWSACNDLISNYDDPGWDTSGARPDMRRTIMDCCGGYANRGLYLAWHNAVAVSGRRVTLHMLVSRRTKEAAIQNLMPHRDLLKVTLERPGELAVRIPSSAVKGRIAATSRGRNLPFRTEADYLVIGDVPPGQAVEITFGFVPRRESITTGEPGLNAVRNYDVTWMGDRVIGISPDGKFSPLYNHRAGTAAAELPCHLPAREIDW